MGNTLLQTIVYASILLGMYAARTRRLRTGVWRLLALLLAFDTAYLLLLYYLRYRWL
jgi:hypothetical protein